MKSVQKMLPEPWVENRFSNPWKTQGHSWSSISAKQWVHSFHVQAIAKVDLSSYKTRPSKICYNAFYLTDHNFRSEFHSRVPSGSLRIQRTGNLRPLSPIPQEREPITGRSLWKEFPHAIFSEISILQRIGSHRQAQVQPDLTNGPPRRIVAYQVAADAVRGVHDQVIQDEDLGLSDGGRLHGARVRHPGHRFADKENPFQGHGTDYYEDSEARGAVRAAGL